MNFALGRQLTKMFYILFYGFRHVHITEATLYKLNNEYHVEPYLTDPFQTYLILPSEVRLCYEII